MIGSTVGSYQVVAKLGEGGMGEVYRARDTKLDRDVALKILPDAFAADPDRLLRFKREAKTLASLNHPNIAAIYGLEDSGHNQALVMELVEGDDLSVRIGRGAVPLEEAIVIARQLADALEVAHDQNIIHRDLKPANIKVRHDGAVKILDFGLAKAMDASVSEAGSAANSPTMLSPAMTQQGFIIGTAAYMSPEQAKGRPVDKRADIWAFGVVLFEMLTGRPLYRGETISETLAAVIKDAPDLSALPATTSPRIRALMARCLERDPKRRLRDIGEARIALETPDIGEPDRASDTRSIPPSSRTTTWTARIGWLAIGLVVGAGVWAMTGGVLSRGTASGAASSTWAAARLGGPAFANRPRVSPDGKLVAFVAMVDGQSQVAVMTPSTGNWTIRSHDRTHGLIEMVAWSPDGSRLYYHRLTDAPTGVFSVPALGGEERLVLENASYPEPLPDGSLIVVRINSARDPQLHRYWPANGKLEPLPVLIRDLAVYAGGVRSLADGRLLIVGRPLGTDTRENGLYTFALDSGAIVRVTPEVPSGSLSSIAIDPSGAVLAALRDRGAYRVLRFVPGQSAPPESLFTLLSTPAIDADAQGAIYVSQYERPGEILRIRDSDASFEILAAGPGLLDPIALADGRVLINTRGFTNQRVIVATPGKDPVAFVENDEPTNGPMTRVGADRVALLIGAGDAPDIAIVKANNGQLVRRLKAPAGIMSLGASPDGKTLYVAASGSISAMPIDGGAGRPLGPGDSLVVDPDSGDLIVKLDEQERYRLVRLSPAGGTPRSIDIKGDYRMVPKPLQAGGFRNGRLVFPIASADSWYWYVGVLDVATGRLDRIPVKYATDFQFVTWAPDGRIIATGLGVQSTLWKFSPVESGGK